MFTASVYKFKMINWKKISTKNMRTLTQKNKLVYYVLQNVVNDYTIQI